MRILYVTTIGTTMNFFKCLVGQLVNQGNCVDIACNDTLNPVPLFYTELGCRIHTISCTRSPFHPGSMFAIHELRSLIKREQYDIVHCHTPVAAFCTRVACVRLPCKVIYTAHGFHFYKGAPFKNWLLFYPAEKICAYFTDVLITINKEDYALAKSKLKARQVLYVPGVGIDLTAFAPDHHVLSRSELAIPEGNRILLSVGELIHRKNHELLIRAVAGIPNTTTLIVGSGPLEHDLKALSQELMCDVRFLGYRKDIADLCRLCDLFALPSFHEGLSVALMEAMACAKAVSCSSIRGTTDLVDMAGGTLFDPFNVDSCRTALEKALSGDLAAMGQHNRQRLHMFSIEEVNRQMLKIYAESLHTPSGPWAWTQEHAQALQTISRLLEARDEKDDF